MFRITTKFHYSRRGVSLVEAVVAVLILAIGTGAIVSGAYSAQRQQRLFNETVASKAAAIELTEVFRSFQRKDRLVAYLTTLPGPYRFCTQANDYDWATRTRSQATPIADLPHQTLHNGTPANRDFRVEVLNIETMEVDSTRCGQPMAGLSPPLGNNDRLLVTVGVSWAPPAGDGTFRTDSVRRVTLSTLLPE